MVAKKQVPVQKFRRKTGIPKKVLSVLVAFSLVVMFPMTKLSLADPVISPDPSAVEYGDSSTEQQADNPGGDEATSDNQNADTQSSTTTENQSGTTEESTAENTSQEETQPSTGSANPFASIGIMPMSINPVPGASGTVTVDNWQDLRQAMADPGVSEIRFTTNIQRDSDASTGNDLPALSRSLVIDGQGYTLDFRANGSATVIQSRGIELNTNAPSGSQFTLKNVNIIRPNGGLTQLICASGIVTSSSSSTAQSGGQSWTVNLSDVVSPTASGTAPSGGLLNIPQGTVNVTGKLYWDNTIVGAQGVVVGAQTVINAEKQYYSAADVNLKSINRTIQAGIEGESNIISVTNGTTMKVESTSLGDTQAVFLGRINQPATTTATTGAQFIVDGANTTVDVTGWGNGYGYETAAFVMNGNGSGSFDITGGAKVNIYSKQAPTGTTAVGCAALSIQLKDSYLNVSGAGTELNVESWGEAPTGYDTQGKPTTGGYGAVLIMLNGISQNFTVSDQAKLTVTQHKNSSDMCHTALSLAGQNNNFTVTSGASIVITNEGSGTAVPTRSDNLFCNAAVEFFWGTTTFNINGYQSTVALYSNNGSAINAVSTTNTTNNTKVQCDSGAIFIAQGKVNTTGGSSQAGIINAGNPNYPGSSFSFSCNSPQYYDFVNTYDGAGARIFGVGLSNGSFSSTNSDVSLWGNGTQGKPNNLWTDPFYRSWTLNSYTLTGANFSTLTSSSDSTFNTTADSFGSYGLTAYRRISGNNAGPIISQLLQPTNADKYLRALGTVPEGLNIAGVPWYTGEVFGRLLITHAAGGTETSQAGQFLSLASENIYTVENAGTLTSVLRYTPPNGNFLTVGDTYQITSAWRGDVDDPNAKVHLSPDWAILTGPVTVTDVLPPVPATITTPSNGRIWAGAATAVTGTWLPAAAQAAAQPNNPDPAVKLYAVANTSTNVLKDSTGATVYGTLDPSGTWTYPLNSVASSYLAMGNKIYFILEDATGNANPLVKTAIHDTSMDPAPYLTVTEPDLALSSENQTIGLIQARELAQLGTNSAAQKDALLTLINAKATKVNPSTLLSTNVQVTVVDPNWDSVSYYDTDSFRASDPTGKTYIVNFSSVDDPSIASSATVTVVPYATPYIDAHDFTMSVSNATTMMNKPLAQRNADLINYAEAQGRLDLGLAMSPANVEVSSLAIPNPATAGDFDVTFHVIGGSMSDPNYFVTVKAHLTMGNAPVIMAAPVLIWIGDPAEPFKSAGGDRPDNSILPSQCSTTPGTFDYMYGVKAYDTSGGADITSRVTHTGTVDMTKVDLYTVTYSVTNDDGNTTTFARTVACTDGTIVIDDNYMLRASSFVKKQADANAGTILADSKAAAYYLDPSAPSGRVDTDAVVSSAGGYGAGCALGTYNITIQVAPRTGQPATTLDIGVQAVVVNKDVLNDSNDPNTNIRYTIGANNASILISEASSYAGLSDSAKLNLINKSLAEAWMLNAKSNHLGAVPPLTSLADSGVDVVSNSIPATGGVSGQSYNVVFSIKTVPSITVTVVYTMGGTPPTITFDQPDGYPLVVPFARGSAAQNMTADDIKAKMSVLDDQDGDLKNITTYTVNGVPGGTINTGNVGVYQVTYSVTNSLNMTTTATRAIVVDDGRYVIDRTNGVIIGAKNFVAKSADVNGTLGQVRSWSRANAYDLLGNPYSSTEFTVDPFPPAGSGYTANAPEGTYSFTWKVIGKPTEKTITGYIVNADVIYPGEDNDQYAMTANNFQVNTTDAAAMIAAGLNNSLISKSNVQVIKLVDGVDDATPYVISNGGFSTTEAIYNLTFGATIGANPVITSPKLTQVSPTGTVTNGNPPTLTCPTPLEVWIGSGAKPTNAITPAQYTSVPNDMYGVTADDVEDGPLTDKVIVTHLVPSTGVDLTTPGLYTLSYSVTDADHLTVTKQRVVVVNDGSYTVGNGRILYAKSFVTRLQDVSTNPDLLQGEVLSKSRAKLYDGTTGSEISLDSGSLSSVLLGGYGPSAGIYNITINALDTPTGTVSKSITGIVIQRDVVGPDNPPTFGPTTYVYGDNVSQTVTDAVSTATAGDSAILDLMHASATKFTAEGTVVTPGPGVKIVQDLDNYKGIFTSANPSDGNNKIFRFLVSDTEDQTVITLTIKVGSGFDDLALTALPKPLVLDMPVASSDIDGSGNLTTTKLMDGVTATDKKAITTANPSGDVRDKVVMSITDVSDGGSGTVLTAVPANKAGIYRVTYSYTDANLLTITDTRAVVVNDGRYKIDDKYILQALNFVIRSTDVATTSASTQLLEKSQALAWNVEGQPTAADISNNGGYGSGTGDKYVDIQVLGYPALMKTIIARVLDDNSTAVPNTNYNGENGVSNSIVAHNFRINAIDANALVAQAGTPAYRDAFFTRSDLSIYDRTSATFGNSPNVTKQLVSDGGFATSGTLKQGDQFTVTFACAEDPTATTTITVFVDNGNPPVIDAPAVRFIWAEDPPAPSAGMLLPSDWISQGGMNGVTAMDDYDGNLTDKVIIGSVGTGGAFTPGDPIKMTDDTLNVYQDVSYQVTDSDHNTTTKTVQVVYTNFPLFGDYFMQAYSFVKRAADVDTSDSAILSDSHSSLDRIKSNDPSVPAPVDVSDLLFVGDKGGYSSTPKDYTIAIDSATPEAGYEGHAALDITAKVVDKDVLGDGFDPAVRYTVGANNGEYDYNLAKNGDLTGTGAAATQKLIDITQAQAWRIPNNTIEDWDVMVVSNQIGDSTHPIVPNGVYQVTFAPKDHPSITATVTIKLSSGNSPVIAFQQNPLVLQQTDASKPLTADDLKAGMTVTDVEDGDLWDATTATVTGGATLNQHNIGVWKIRYSVTDSDGNTTTAYRAVVITDGRYIYDENDDIIIGARDYVVAQSDVDGTEGQAISLSYAEAFTFIGDPLSVNWTGRPAGYTAQAAVGDYQITWTVAGRTTTKTITAHVSNADVVDPGGKDSSYAITANHFSANLEQARAIVNGGQQAFIDAAKVQVIKLVPTVPDRAPLLVDTAGFTDVENVYYPVLFRIDGIPVTEEKAGVKGTVSQGDRPVITATTPLEVWIGADPNDPRRSTFNSILPSQYSALYDVTATDTEDDAAGLPLNVTATADPLTGPVDLTKPGMYKITYDVVDSDGNHPDKNPTRIVVVNDGRYTVGEHRILYAKSFVTKIDDVSSNPANLDQEILNKSGAALYNGETGAAISSTDISVSDNGGYKKAEGVYDITIAGVDFDTSMIYNAIQGEVVDAQVIDTEPTDPNSDSYTVFGNNLDLQVFEAQAIIDSPAGRDAALLTALGAGARKSLPNGTLQSVNPIIVDDGGFKAETGNYYVTVADEGQHASITLLVRVDADHIPWITAVPTPLEYQYQPGSTQNLTRDDIMKGVTAGDMDDGDITDRVVINPDASGQEQLPTIPWNTGSVTQITYKVTNSNGFSATVSRALIVNDGSIVHDDRYILRARSFVINVQDVTLPYDQLVLDQSGARAWKADGTPATATVVDLRGFQAIKADYKITIGIKEYASLTRDITAKVTDGEAGNGDTYSIVAWPFRINLADAAALQSTSGSAYDQAFLTRAGVESYLRSDPTLVQGGTPVLADDGGFKTAVFAQEGDPNYPTVIPVTFWVDEDHTATVTVNVTISNGNHPWIKVPDMKVVGLGTPFTDANYMEGVTYGDVEDDISLLKVTYTDVVDTNTEGIYKVTYTVTDTEGNTGSAIGFVLVGPWVFDGDYGVSAWNFVTTPKAIQDATSVDDLILSRSHAKAVHLIRDADGNVVDIEEIAPVVKDSDGLSATEGEYSPSIGVATEDKPVITVNAKVINKDEISNEPDPSGDIHDTNTTDPTDTSRYIVGANDVALTWAQAGELANKMDQATKDTLIGLAQAAGYKITNTTDPVTKLSSSTTTDYPVDVSVNEIQQATGYYNVTFIPQGVGGVSVTVKFSVLGSAASLVVDGPLEVDATDTSSILTRNQLLEGVSVYDVKTPPLTDDDVVITDATGKMPVIDTSETGVYQVTYTLTDPQVLVDDGHGHMVPTTITVERAVVVNDGRFIVDPNNEIIVGAKDFVVSTKDITFTGTANDAMRLSYAEAYDFEGSPLTVELASTLPTGFANRQIGTYDFSFRAVGYPATVKSIKGEVVDADVVDNGPNPYNSRYTLIASNFSMDVSEAATVSGDADLITAAKARVIKLVPKAADASVVVFDNGGFTAKKGVYPIIFGISGIDQAVRSATINGTVTDAAPPTLSVKTPFEIPVGATWDRQLAMTDVSAIDPGDGDITDKVVYYPTVTGHDVDTSKPGIYAVTYQVEDSDNNVVTASRVVVVNDGRYVVGKGRILEASSFVIKLQDVPSSAAQIPAHLLAMTGAKAYDGTTGDQLPASLLSIYSTGGYGRTVGEYDIVVTVPDVPSGNISKTVKGKVVDADVIDNKPLDPNDPTGSKVFVYGNNITLRVSQAAAITTDDALLKALNAHATLTNVTDPAGTLTDQGVMVVSNGGFSSTPGTYNVKVADVDGICTIDLTVMVVIGEAPVITPQHPLIVPINTSGGALTDAQKIGTTTAYDKEDGDLTSKIQVIGSVPGNVEGLYPVTYKVTDSDGNTTQVTNVVAVDAGNITYGDNYMLYAKSFTLDRSEVDNINKSAQILSKSGAYAMSYEGVLGTATVSNEGGYQNVAGVYHPTIMVAQEPSTTRQITATVTAPVQYRVTFNANGGWLTGPSAIYVQAPATTLAYLPSSPLRTGYSFTYWSTSASGGTQFTQDYPVTSNMTVYAQWNKDAAPPTPVNNTTNNYTTNNYTTNPPANNTTVYTTNPPANVYVTNPPATAGDTYVTVEPATTPTTTPTATLPTTNTPLAPATPTTHWSLFDLCAVVLALLLLLAFLVKFFFDRRKRDEEYNEEPIDAAALSNMAPERRAALLARREEDRRAFMEEQRAKDNKQKAMYVNAPALLIVAAAFIESLIILLTTQDFTSTMVMTDVYSIPLSLIVLVQLITPMVAAMLKNRNDRNRGGESPSTDSPSV